MPCERRVISGNDPGGVTLRALEPFFHYLVYTVSVDGADPLFVLVDVKLAGIGGEEFDVKKAANQTNVLLVSDGTPKKTYVRRWPNDQELDAMQHGDFHKHVLGMSFLKAVRYRFKVEMFNIRNESLGVVTEIEWSGQGPDTECFEPFSINIR